MFVLIWSALFVSVKGSIADTGDSALAQQHCDKGYCLNLTERELTAEAGLCVVIPCSFTTAANFTPKHIVWYKCEASQKICSDADIIFHSNKTTDTNTQSGFEGRVSRLEPDVSQNNCSIIINDLKESDNGSYQLRVTGELNGKQDGFTFIPRVTVSVKGLNQKRRVKIPTLTEGQQATLTCTAPGLCSGSVPKITWTWRGAGGTESYIAGNSTAFKTGNLTAFRQRHISTLTFNPSSEQHNTSVTCKINFTGGKSTQKTFTLNVNHNRAARIIGNTTVKEGDVLNLTCSVESFPPSVIVWSKCGSNTKLHNDTGSAILVVRNVTSEHSGQYICTVKHLDTAVTSYVDVTVTWHTKIQNGSGCVLQSEGLTCVCINEGFPLPNITWPLLNHHTEYSVITSVLNHTVNSTVSVTVKNHGNSTVECVSNNGNGEERENLLINNNLSKKDVLQIYDGQALQNNQTLNSNSGTNEVEYATIDFSLLKTHIGRKAARTQESTKTEYAEIKKIIKKEQEDDGGDDGKMLEGEMKHCEPEKKEEEDEAVYSTVNDIIDDN
ncbi:sialic acid-binding Ig-like lectin 14 [Pelmatolapia mariae]|uniref:sialic acid-binding Ig-like lectin 14 n=1 Tax=Pelmatolapia mariae TaxID=158779 RepID=UPI002FE662DF